MTDARSVSSPVGPLISAARNGEDVVLRRALGDVAAGRFLEFRDPADAAEPPALRALLDLGWSGSVGSAAELADPVAVDDRVAAVGPGDLHVILVAADLDPGDPAPVLRLARRGPWVLVVGVHPDHDRAPLTSALAAAGYRCRLYDGVSAYFVAADHDDDLGVSLSYPACARDDYLPRSAAQLLAAARRREALAVESALRWREKAVQSWADNSTGGVTGRKELLQLRAHADDLANQLRLLQQTLSWRVTAPLRGVRRLRTGAPR